MKHFALKKTPYRSVPIAGFPQTKHLYLLENTVQGYFLHLLGTFLLMPGVCICRYQHIQGSPCHLLLACAARTAETESIQLIGPKPMEHK